MAARFITSSPPCAGRALLGWITWMMLNLMHLQSGFTLP
jgi:hypothetical protein